MKAMTYDRFGGDDVLSLTEQPRPKVGPGEILVRVRAAAVNPVDWKVMSGGLDPLMEAHFPVIPGWDVAGTVEEVGIDAPEFTQGEEVVGYARKDVVQAGTMAEYVTLAVRHAARKPSRATWAQAAGLPLAGLTAWQALNRLEVGKGSAVLIHAAAGGVGIAAVQLARHLGATTVIGTASEGNHPYLRELGATPVTYGDGLVERVRKIAPDGVDVVLDLVGGVEEQTMAVLKPGGHHGSITDPDVLEHGGQWIWVRPDHADLTELSRLVDDGVLRVDVAREFELEKLPEAFALSREGHTRGKIVVTVG